MATEIEYKYLVKNVIYKSMATSFSHITQGYLCKQPERTVRIRIRDDKAFLTVKGKNSGAVRQEFEYPIPYEDALKLLEMCISPILEKTRYIVPFKGHIWEVDEFAGSRTGLVTAEIELSSPEEDYEIPDFVGKNVTGDTAYYNSNL